MNKFNKNLCSDSSSVLVIEKTFFLDLIDNLYLSNNFKMKANNHITWHSIFNQIGQSPMRHIIYRYTQNE
jgi:hypothetical protein